MSELAAPVGSLAGVGVGFAAARARLARRPTLASAVLGAALVVVAAAIERRFGSAGAVDRTLAATFNLVVPLVAFGVAAEACARRNLRDAVWPLARYGLSRRAVAAGTVGAALLTSAALGAVFAVLAVALGHAAGNPPLARDALTSGWIGALTCAAYAAWFCFGATFGRRGGGRWLPLLADFVLGGTSGVVGAVFPRGHATSLLGLLEGAPPLGLSQAASSAALLLTPVVLAVAAALRAGD